jgi:para-nitrobenzyl esterase
MEHYEPSESPVERTVQSGKLLGSSRGGICRFLGIPYAEAPAGEKRFREPRPRKSWEGSFDATRKGPSAPYKLKDFPGVDIVPLVGEGGSRDPDYLRLNIWTPEQAEGRPVLVWIHGGGFVLGSKDAAVHDGSAFAASGLVCVAVNYRLGIDGFLPIPGIPTNLGLRDILCALQWVRDNIASFGGDPDKVTVCGESAGAMAIADLITSPLAKGLFQRAIVQSGHGGMVRDIGVAQRLVRKLARLLRIAPDEQGFRSVDFDRGWAAMQKLANPLTRLDLRNPDGIEPVFGISRFVPVFGDDVLPKMPLEALVDGAGAEVDLLIGTNKEEMNLYFVPTRVKDKLPGFLARWLLGKSLPAAGKVLKSYGLGERGKRAGAVFTEALTDLAFRWPARRFAEEHRGSTHVYEFDWRSPRFDGALGAAHGMEVPFVFKTLETVSGPLGLVGENPPTELANRIHDIWVGFARDGAIPWPAFDRANRNVHHLAADRTIEEAVMPAAPFLP